MRQSRPCTPFKLIRNTQTNCWTNDRPTRSRSVA